MNHLLDNADETTRPLREATLVQVAQHAGVSTVTASLVLNKSRSNTRVSATTRQRIIESAQLLHYRPNVLARSLRQRKTNVIAFFNAQNVNFSLAYPFYAALLSGVQEGCTEHQKDLLFHANFAGRNDDEIFLGLNNGQIDGLVLYLRTMTPLVQRLVESPLPLVTLLEEVPGVPSVSIDSEGGGRMLARHVASKGYKRVLYRSLAEQVPSTSQLLRKRGFVDEATLLGLQVTYRAHSRFDRLDLEEQELLLSPPSERPEVVVCWNDTSADDVVGFCLRQGLKVPQDVAVTGFDGLTSTQRPSLLLTTIGVPWWQAAKTAVGVLVAHSKGDAVPDRTILPVELFEGTTT